MGSPIDLQQILNAHLKDYRQHHRLDPRRTQVLSHLTQCRTETLGGLRLHCEHCHEELSHYYACRDRHCPQCQWQASQHWAEKQRVSQLPVNYHHLAFTLPETLNGWVELHPEVLYRLLFQTAWATLNAFGQDPKRLGGQMGMTAVLHTWGLDPHPPYAPALPGAGRCAHPGRDLAGQQERLSVSGAGLVPALSRPVGQPVAGLRPSRSVEAHHPARRDRRRPGSFDGPGLGGLQQALSGGGRPSDRLLGQIYDPQGCGKCRKRRSGFLPHRTAINNARILALEQGEVTFRYKDYQDHNRWKMMELAVEEFIRRFLLHVLPKGLVRIRHYGFLANACRAKQLARIRQALAEADSQPADDHDEATPLTPIASETWCICCPTCHRPMRLLAEIQPVRLRFEGG